MINNITIDGIAYKLIDNPDKLTLSCDKCDLIYFCQQELGFIHTCENINNNKFQYTDKKEELKGLLRNYE